MGRLLWLPGVALLVAASTLLRWGPSHTGLLVYLAAVAVLAVAAVRFVARTLRADQNLPTPKRGPVRDPGVAEGRVLPRGITRGGPHA